MAGTHLAFVISVISLAATFFLSLAFVVVYGLSRWWEHESGRNMMAFDFVIMLVTGLSLARLIFDDHTWFLWLRVCVLAFVPIIIGWRLLMLIRVQYFTLDDRSAETRRYDAKHDQHD